MNKDFAKGMIVSLALKSLPVRKKAPIAYLYNGVRLPALPEWDRERYPYAVISSPSVFGYLSNEYALTITSAPLYVAGTIGSISLKSTDEVTYKNYSYDEETKTWKLALEATGTFTKSWGVRWVNYDILEDDGSVHKVASEPVPVYE